jgi:hypothetical protein
VSAIQSKDWCGLDEAAFFYCLNAKGHVSLMIESTYVMLDKYHIGIIP